MKKYSVSIILLIFLFIACKKEDFNIDNLNDEIIILGHGGMGIGQAYPMDSFESILKCINSGANGSEMDVQLTKDSVLVAYHSKDLSDNTNLSGVINDLNWNEIKNAYYVNTPYLNYKIISLDQLFSNIDNIRDYKFTFDCKLYTNKNSTDFQNIFANSIVKIIDKFGIENCVYIESQSKDFLIKLKGKNENYKLFIYPSSFENGLKTALDLDLYGITISTEDISKDQIEIAHSNNLYVAIWNTHSKNKNIEAVKKNPDFIQTDRVEHLVRLLE